MVWTGSLTKGGYGQFNAGLLADGRKDITRAHRYAWTIEHGAIPAGLSICHHCDNRRCVNPAHLFLGIHGDNNRDMFGKGRGHVFDGTHILGARNVNSKLAAEDVLEIRALRARGVPLSEVSQRFNITKANVSSIARGKT